MAGRFVLEALKHALIASIKEKHPDGVLCKQCDAPYETLHVIKIPFGFDKITVCLCEHCLLELKDYITRKEQQQYNSVFGEQVRMLLGQETAVSYIEEDMDGMGTYYSVAMYKSDHL